MYPNYAQDRITNVVYWICKHLPQSIAINIITWWALHGYDFVRSIRRIALYPTLSRQSKLIKFWWWFFETFGKLDYDPDCDGVYWNGSALGDALYLYSSSRGMSVSLTIQCHRGKGWTFYTRLFDTRDYDDD